MGQAQIDVDAMAGATAFPHQEVGPVALAAEADADPGDVGDPPAGLLLPADGALAFRDAAQLDRFALPAVKAKDAVCLLDRYPDARTGTWQAAGRPANLSCRPWAMALGPPMRSPPTWDARKVGRPCAIAYRPGGSGQCPTAFAIATACGVTSWASMLAALP